MKVLKFGGTSVGKPERMQHVANLVIADGMPKFVVLSALSGTTNTLFEICQSLSNRNINIATRAIENLKEKYLDFSDQLLQKEASKNNGIAIIDEHFGQLESFTLVPFSPLLEKEILAQGELLSTKLFMEYLLEKKYSAVLLPALDFMRLNEEREPDTAFIKQKLNKIMNGLSGKTIYLTQGYICRNIRGEVDNLQRGGSDYTASLIGAAIQAQEIQIWTDIDGMHNNDPRIVDKTVPVAELSFEEAAELAYFGAKILHPYTIRPAQKANIPVRLLNTLQPDAPGTIISDKKGGMEIKAVAAKDGITAIKIKSSRMLLAYGFLCEIFGIFERYHTPIDMITTSEVAVTLTIDDEKQIDNILREIKNFGEVEVDKNQTIICIVGNMLVNKRGVVKRVIDAFGDLPIRMVSYGGSHYNISVLVDSSLKIEALTLLNQGLFHL